MKRSLLRVTLFASVHSQRFGLSGYSLGPLADEQIFDIATDLVRLFERRYEVEIKKAPPTKSEAPSGFVGSARTRRQRMRDQ